MNTNRMPNHCVTPPGVPYQNRPMRRPAGVPGGNQTSCVEICETICPVGAESGIIGTIIGQNRQEDCDKEYALQGLPIAMAYVPWQTYANIYPVPQALRMGTMFAELNLDFMGRRCN